MELRRVLGLVLSLLLLAAQGAMVPVAGAHPAPGPGAAPVQATIYYRGITVVLDGRPLAEEPFIYEGRTWLPVRAVAEALGFGVRYDAATGMVFLDPASGSAPAPADAGEATRAGHAPEPVVVTLYPDAGGIVVAGEILAHTPLNYQGRTWLPVRAVAESLGLQVGWDEEQSRVILVSGRMVEQTTRAWGVVGVALAEAGSRLQEALLAGAEDAASTDPGASARERMAAGLGAAAAELRAAAGYLAEVLEDGAPDAPSPSPAVELLAAMAEDLGQAAEGVLGRDGELAAAGLAAFNDRLMALGRGLPERAAPHLADAARAAGDAGFYLAELGEADVAASLFAAAAQTALELGPAGLKAEAEELLTLASTEEELDLYRLLGLDDPQVSAGFNLLTTRPDHPELMEWAGVVRTDPVGWTDRLMYAAAPAALYHMATGLSRAGVAMLATPYELGFSSLIFRLFGCPDECPQVCQTQNCGMVNWAVGTDRANPDDVDRAIRALDLVNDLGGEKTSVPALSDVVTAAAQALVHQVKAARPSIWVQVGWEHCESISCWIRWSRRVWVSRSEWAQVEAQNRGGVWLPMRDWRRDTLVEIDRAMAEKVRQMCRTR